MLGWVTPPRRSVLQQPQIFVSSSNYRQVCRGRIYASRAVCPLCCIARTVARAAYMPPLRMTRDFRVAVMPRAGLAPPLPRDGFLSPRRGNGQPPQISPSSVTCGDTYPQKGGAERGSHPARCHVERIARAAYMPPLQTNPYFFALPQNRGRGNAPPLPCHGFYCRTVP